MTTNKKRKRGRPPALTMLPPIPDTREITLPRRDYQPPKEKQEEEFDMLDADAETVRKAFFRPFKVRVTDPDPE